jgi:hypothetical protein
MSIYAEAAAIINTLPSWTPHREQQRVVQAMMRPPPAFTEKQWEQVFTLALAMRDDKWNKAQARYKEALG